MQHYSIKVLCPVHKCSMKFSGWTSPRLVYDLHGDVILVQSKYKCNHHLVERTTPGHDYTSAHIQVIQNFPEDVMMKFPIKMFHQCACTKDMLDYLVVHIGRGQTFMELAEDILSMNFAKYLELHKNTACEDLFYNSLVYSSPSNDLLMHMFLVYFNSVENVLQEEMERVQCSILTCDHTFKVSKHIGVIRTTDMTFVNQFENLFIGINEFGQVVVWRITKSTAFEQVEGILADLKVRLNGTGQSLSMIIVDAALSDSHTTEFFPECLSWKIYTILSSDL